VDLTELNNVDPFTELRVHMIAMHADAIDQWLHLDGACLKATPSHLTTDRDPADLLAEYDLFVEFDSRPLRALHQRERTRATWLTGLFAAAVVGYVAIAAWHGSGEIRAALIPTMIFLGLSLSSSILESRRRRVMLATIEYAEQRMRAAGVQ
jgi:hypothetical protein